MLHKAWNSKGEVPYCFTRSSIKFQGHTGQISPILTQIGCFLTIGRSQLSNPSDLPCFSRSYVKLQGHTAKKKSSSFTQIGRFRTVTPVWIHQWLWNVAQSLKQQRRDALLFSKVIHQISWSHGTNITDFYPNWEFPDYRPVAAFKSLNSPMAMKCCTKLETAKERCPIVFQGHPSNFMVTRYKYHRFLPKLGVYGL